MILEFTLGVLKELDSKGISWGAVLTALLLWNKLIRNKEFKQRDERVERNQRRIMEHWGIEGEWSTPQKTLTQMVLQSLRKWYFSLQAAIARVFHIRRGSKMEMDKRWMVALVTYVLSVIAAKWGIELADGIPEKIVDAVISIANGLMVLTTIVGFWLNKTKKPKEVTPNGSRVLSEDNR